MARRCWTCNTEHDLDEPCRESAQARAERAAGGSVGSLFGGAVAFPARYDGMCIPCGHEIEQGEMIIMSHEYGYIHEECAE